MLEKQAERKTLAYTIPGSGREPRPAGHRAQVGAQGAGGAREAHTYVMVVKDRRETNGVGILCCF